MIPVAETLGVPEPVRDGGTHRIETAPSRRNTLPPSTAAPLAYQVQGSPQTPPSWQELIDTAMRSAFNGVHQILVDARPDPKAPRQRSSIVAVLALVLSIIALIAIGVAIVLHQGGNTEYEKAQSTANEALRKELAAANEALRAQAADNAEFRKELAAQREELAAQRRAMYGLIDVLAEANPKARNVERDLLQH